MTTGQNRTRAAAEGLKVLIVEPPGHVLQKQNKKK